MILPQTPCYKKLTSLEQQDHQIDEGVKSTFYADADGDTYGTSTNPVQACTAPSGYVSDNTDCDDGNASVNPAASEVCNDLDDNCNGSIDDGLIFTTYYTDADGDSFGDLSDAGVSLCNDPGINYSINNTDCNDNNAAINPSITEVCNNLDDNCNGTPDDGLIFTTYYADADGDSYGDLFDTGNSLCSDPGAGYSTNNSDCDDANASVNPGATEICNDQDDNCINGIDEELSFTMYYQDADADGYGNALVSDSACNGAPAGFVADNTDCDDNNANVYPGAQEIPNNGIDDNCNVYIDEFGVGIDETGLSTSFLIVPNPAEDHATIQFTLPQSSHVSIKVYDVSRKEMETLLNENMEQGSHSLLLNTNHFPKGVYMVRMISDFGIVHGTPYGENQKLIVQ